MLCRSVDLLPTKLPNVILGLVESTGKTFCLLLDVPNALLWPHQLLNKREDNWNQTYQHNHLSLLYNILNSKIQLWCIPYMTDQMIFSLDCVLSLKLITNLT